MSKLLLFRPAKRQFKDNLRTPGVHLWRQLSLAYDTRSWRLGTDAHVRFRPTGCANVSGPVCRYGTPVRWNCRPATRVSIRGESWDGDSSAACGACASISFFLHTILKNISQSPREMSDGRYTVLFDFFCDGRHHGRPYGETRRISQRQHTKHLNRD